MKLNLFVDKFKMLGKKRMERSLTELILGLCRANERWGYFATMSPIDWAQT